jgi:glycosyltransferase involved in cell wall biosynthesis
LSSSNDKVSVIIPVYNSERFLVQSIESVLNQTYQNIEVIAVNDGSTDGSGKILEKCSDKIKVVTQKNQGLASALNAGIKNAGGRWFKWFSPDDVLYPESVEVCVGTAKTLPENTLVYTNWEIIDENGTKVRDFAESNYNDLDVFDFNVRLLDGQQINVNTALIPMSLLQKGCKIRDLEDYVAIDYDFFLQAGVLYQTRFHLISRSLLRYRVHKDQLSHQEITKSLAFLPKVRESIFSSLDPSERKRYQHALQEYNEKKPISKKTLELGLRVSARLFPEWMTDKLLLFYLNKLRRGR